MSVSKSISGVLLFVTAFAPHAAIAGNEGAPGGQGVVCRSPQGQITSVQLADYYEGQSTMPGTTLDLGPTTGTYMDIINYVLARLSKIDPVAASRYLGRAQTFESDAFFSAAALSPIDDAQDPIQMQPGCSLAQFALQNYPVKPLQSKYVVDQTIWNGADSVAKAGLVLHEIIYTDALSYGQTTSDNTRYFNYVISSNKMNTLGSQNYVALVKASGFLRQDNSCDFSAVVLTNPALPVCLNQEVSGDGTDSPFDVPQGNVPSGYSNLLLGGIELPVAFVSCTIPAYQPSPQDGCNISFGSENLNFGMESLSITTSQEVRLYSNGQLEEGYLATSQPVKVPDGRLIQIVSGQSIELFPGGTLMNGSILNETSFTNRWNQTVYIKGETAFGPDKFLNSGLMSRPAPLLAQGQLVNFAPGFISFGSIGVTEGLLAQDTQINVFGTLVHMASNSSLSLNDDESFNQGTVSQPAIFSVQGISLQIQSGDLEFWSNGSMRQANIQGGVSLQQEDQTFVTLNGSKEYQVNFDQHGLLTDYLEFK